MGGHVDKLAFARVNLLMAIEVRQFQVSVGVLATPGLWFFVVLVQLLVVEEAFPAPVAHIPLVPRQLLGAGRVVFGSCRVPCRPVPPELGIVRALPTTW